MARYNFQKLASGYAASMNLMGNLPVIEKELLHYEILRALDDAGYFSALRFQGGTCLRLCYGSQRYSEDLDFCAGDAFSEIDPRALVQAVRKSIEGTYGMPVCVHEPTEPKQLANAQLSRWVVVVDTTPARPDLPSQRVKIEVASVPAHTLEFRQMDVHYPGLPVGYDSVLCPCQAPEEIFADKFVSFANTETYLRHRDLWDMPWLMRQPDFDKTGAMKLALEKHADYGVTGSFEELAAKGLAILKRETTWDGFAATMRRFLPPDTYAKTVGRREYLDVLRRNALDIYAAAGNIATK